MLEWIQAGSQLLNAVGGLGGSPPPSQAYSGLAPTVSRADLDFSGFTVATGQARADGAKISKTSSDSLSGAPAAAPAPSGVLGAVALAAGSFLAIKAFS